MGMTWLPHHQRNVAVDERMPFAAAEALAKEGATVARRSWVKGWTLRLVQGDLVEVDPYGYPRGRVSQGDRLGQDWMRVTGAAPLNRRAIWVAPVAPDHPQLAPKIDEVIVTSCTAYDTVLKKRVPVQFKRMGDRLLHIPGLEHPRSVRRHIDIEIRCRSKSGFWSSEISEKRSPNVFEASFVHL